MDPDDFLKEYGISELERLIEGREELGLLHGPKYRLELGRKCGR